MKYSHNSGSTVSDSQGLPRVVRRLLRPVLAFCVRRSLRLREILEIAKSVLVEIAVEELQNKGEEVSVSRVALMTGVHRKDVTELIRQQAPRPSGETLFQRLIGQWRSDKRFSNSGYPRPLSHVGQDSEFATLVRSVNRELNPYSILFELTRMGAVEERRDGVYLLKNEYVPVGKLEDRFALVGRDVDDLVRAAEENIIAEPEVPNLHLSTTYDNINPADLPKIRRWFMHEGAKLHERARQFLSKHDFDINPARSPQRGGARVVIGTFSFSTDQGKSSQPASTDTSARRIQRKR